LANPFKIAIIIKPHEFPRWISVEIDPPLGVEDLVYGQIARLPRRRVGYDKKQTKTPGYGGAPQAMNGHLHIPHSSSATHGVETQERWSK
jgi:hypothetical protein